MIWEPVDPVPIGSSGPGVAITNTADPMWARSAALIPPHLLGPPGGATPGGSGGSGRRKSKKKRASGLDFVHRSRSKGGGGRGSGSLSADPSSRAGSPTQLEDQGGPAREVIHSLDHVVGESRHWVINKSAGETILHRYHYANNLKFILLTKTFTDQKS